MSASTITAEGGTIRLSTASDGSVSASSGDFAVAVVQQVVGASVTQFATVAALITASEGSLAVGYYEVLTAPRYITYWDGFTFDPPPVFFVATPVAASGSVTSTTTGGTKYEPVIYLASYDASRLDTLAVNVDGTGGTPALTAEVKRWADIGGDATADARETTIPPVRSTVHNRPSVFFDLDILRAENYGVFRNKGAAVIMAIATQTDRVTTGNNAQILYNVAFNDINKSYWVTLDIPNSSADAHRGGGRRIKGGTFDSVTDTKDRRNLSTGQISALDYANARIFNWTDGVEVVTDPAGFGVGTSSDEDAIGVTIGNFTDLGFARPYVGHIERIIIKDTVPSAREIRAFNDSWLLFHTVTL